MNHVSIGLISLGCAKNQVDSQVLFDTLQRAGFRLAPCPEEADIILVNTCAFIKKAVSESEQAIRAACEIKKNGPCRAVIVTGCLPQRYADLLPDKFPDVDAFVGLDAISRIGEIADGVLAGHSHHARVYVSSQASSIVGPTGRGVVFSTGAYAYLKIADGCSHGCSYCTIPKIRGRYRSRPISDIQQEARALVERGFRELTLVAQDVTAFGSDSDDNSSLPRLLRALNNLDGRFWIRIMYAHPSGITESLLEAMAELDHVVHYLDVPIQHSDPRVLAKMGRATTATIVNEFPSLARGIMPDIVLRTTCMVGHPGESEAAFDNLLEYLEHWRFEHVGVFTYSPEEGTPSATMEGRPSTKVARERRNRLLSVQTKINQEKKQTLVGSEETVLVEKQVASSKALWQARSYRQAPEVDGCVLARCASKNVRIGDFAKVRYTGFRSYNMIAEYCKGED